MPQDGAFFNTKTLQELPQFDSRELPADAEAVGWLAFELPQPMISSLYGATGELPDQWLLSIPLGTETQELDLRKAELADGPKMRPSTIDESVPVIEIGSRLNALNLQALMDPLQSLLQERRGCVILLKDQQLVVDQIAQSRLRSMSPEQTRPNVSVYLLYSQQASGTVMNTFGNTRLFRNMMVGEEPFMSAAYSEAFAVIRILSERPNADKLLTQQLRSDAPDARLAAASELRTHVHQPAVFDALNVATRDENIRVRTAAIHTLNGYFSGTSLPAPSLVPPSAPVTRKALEGELLEAMLATATDPDVDLRSAAISILGNSRDPRVTHIILAAMNDSEWTVRTSAAYAAGNQPVDAVADSLMQLLDDERIRDVACRSLGQLKFAPAIPKLKELCTAKPGMTGMEAINALHAMGAMSDTEAAIAKLEQTGYLPAQDRMAIVQTKDARVISRLQEMLPKQERNLLVACLLAEMGEPSAYEPLITVATAGGSFVSADVYRALGALGDKRAIEPLQKKLAAAHFAARTAILEPLLMLQAPGAFEQATEEIAKLSQSDVAKGMLAVLGRTTGNRAIPVLKHYLDDDNLWRTAAVTLWEIGTPEAAASLQGQLEAEDYARSEEVLASLLEQANYQAQLATEDERKTLVQRMYTLLQELKNCSNPATSKAAQERLKLFPNE